MLFKNILSVSFIFGVDIPKIISNILTVNEFLNAIEYETEWIRDNTK